MTATTTSGYRTASFAAQGSAFALPDDDEPAVAPPPSNPIHRLRDAPAPTSFKKKTTKKYRRRDVTERDILLLAFLARFKFSNSTQIAHLLGVKPNSAHRRLLGLAEMGLVATPAERVLGAKKLWFVTGKGLSVLEDEAAFDVETVKRVRYDDLETSQLGHYLAVNQVAIQLLTDKNPLRLPPGLPRVRLRDLVSEYQIASSWGAWRAAPHDGVGDLAYRARKWRQGEFATKGMTQALESDAGLWTLVQRHGSEATTNTYHHPDLVLRGSDGAPFRAIGIEVEIHKKSVADYARVIRNFAEDREVYDGGVVWVVLHKNTAERIQTAAQSVGYTGKGKCWIAPLCDWTGAVYQGKAWRL